jgi:hypothetical protein
MLIYYLIASALVAVVFNMANRNLRKEADHSNRKSAKKAISDWEAFKKQHPGKDSENNKS